MYLLYFVGIVLLLLLLAFAINFDYRRPMSKTLRYKYRVKDNSIFRKIIKFKDKGNYPCNYFKVVPIYVLLVFAIISLFLLFIDIFGNGVITTNINRKIFIIISLCLIAISIIYFLTITIWWEVVDYKEFKFTKKEKDKLKKIKQSAKENKSKKM